MPKVLILGESGQLARALHGLAWPAGFAVTTIGRRQLGAADQAADAAATTIKDKRPDLVLNAAAFTAVDRAESQEALARTINAAQPRTVAEACGLASIPLVHVSTDYVFDGRAARPYVETDKPNPLNTYGRTKLAGDEGIQQVARAPWAILRTSWVFSEAADSFPAKILSRALSGETLRVVSDQEGCPTPAAALAAAMQSVGLRLLQGHAAAQGLFNYCGAQAMSWHGFAARLIDCAVESGMKRPDLQPISSDQFPTAARRPRNSVLDCTKIGRELGIPPAEIDAEIERVVRVILARLG